MIQALQSRIDKSKERQVRLKETMFTGFQPIFRICRVFGLLPFSIVYNLNGEIESCKVNRVDCVWFAVSICIYLSLVIFNYHVLCLNLKQLQKNATFVLIMGNYLLQLFTFICSSLFFILNMWNRQIFIDVLKNFERFDKEVSQIVRIWKKYWKLLPLTYFPKLWLDSRWFVQLNVCINKFWAIDSKLQSVMRSIFFRKKFLC